MSGFTEARTAMFEARAAAEEHGQPYKLNPDLLAPDECRECGHKLRFKQNGNPDRCEFCNPRTCGVCGNRGEYEQIDGRWELVCVANSRHRATIMNRDLRKVTGRCETQQSENQSGHQGYTRRSAYTTA